MTTAILSFATPGVVALRCAELGLDERRPLEAAPPLAAWSRIYAAHVRDADVLLALGVRIGAWIDGEGRWLERLVAGAVAPLIVEIETRTRPDKIGIEALDVPWELIGRLDPAGAASSSARWRASAVAGGGRGVEAGAEGGPDVGMDGSAARNVVPPPARVTGELAAELAAVDRTAAYHLALDPGVLLGPVRRLGVAAVARPPSAYRLSVVFMAAQPDGVAGLDVEGEEIALRRATGDIGMDLTVDETGTVEGLGETLARVEACDVMHVSCHGLGGPRPALLFEDEHGGRADVTADDLAGGLAGQVPALAFLSACSTAEASSAGRSLASDLCRRGWPAVLGWSSPVDDGAAIRFAAHLYRHLSRRLRLVDVLAQLRRDLHDGSAIDPAGTSAWHQARLYLGASGGGKLVDGTRPRVIATLAEDVLLASGPAAAPAPAAWASVRRRSMQRIRSALRRADHAGVLIHGGGERDRAALAVRVARRQPELRRVTITRHLDGPAVLSEVSSQTVDAEVEAIAARHRTALLRDPGRLAVALREIIEGPCQRAGRGAILLIVHGLERVLIAPPHPGTLARPDAAHLAVIVEILQAFRGAATESRLLLTSAVRFAATDADGDDLAATLLCESLGA